MFQAVQDTDLCSLWSSESVTWWSSVAPRRRRRRWRMWSPTCPTCPSFMFWRSRTRAAPVWCPRLVSRPAPWRDTTWRWSSWCAARWPAEPRSGQTLSSSSWVSLPHLNSQQISDPAGFTVRINLTKSLLSWHQSSPPSHPPRSLSSLPHLSTAPAPVPLTLKPPTSLPTSRNIQPKIEAENVE